LFYDVITRCHVDGRARDKEMAHIDLNDTDRLILDELHDGRNVPANIADELDVSRQYVQQRLRRLREHGYVRNIGRGVYELVEDPRENA